jgi:hypothetical protein
MADAIYRRRRSAISRGEREWRVEPDGLVSCARSGDARCVRWTDIVCVRLCAAPTRAKPWRYVFELQPRHGRRIEIDNTHYAGSGAFEDRSQAYTPFVRAALARLAGANPKARALMGETPIRYFLLLLGALIGLGALAFALIAVKTPLDALPASGLIKLALIFLMLPVFARVLGAAPRGVALDAVPARALPPEPQVQEHLDARKLAHTP